MNVWDGVYLTLVVEILTFLLVLLVLSIKGFVSANLEHRNVENATAENSDSISRLEPLVQRLEARAEAMKMVNDWGAKLEDPDMRREFAKAVTHYASHGDLCAGCNLGLKH